MINQSPNSFLFGVWWPTFGWDRRGAETVAGTGAELSWPVLCETLSLRWEAQSGGQCQCLPWVRTQNSRVWHFCAWHSRGLAHTGERRELKQRTPRHWALCMVDIRLMTDTDHRRGRKRMVKKGNWGQNKTAVFFLRSKNWLTVKDNLHQNWHSSHLVSISEILSLGVREHQG